MAIPLKYNVRSLLMRPTATLMTAFGIALTVTVVLFVMMLLEGMERSFVVSGDPLNVLVLRKGAESEMASDVGRESFSVLSLLPGVQRDERGVPLASGELVVVIVLPRKGSGRDANVTVRGLGQVGVAMRPGVRLVGGRWFDPGLREVAVSRRLCERFDGVGPGREMEFGKGRWRVVGVFDAGGSAADSEIWGDVSQMESDFDRQGAFSSVLLGAADAPSAARLKGLVEEDQRLKLQGKMETEYYAEQTKSGMPIQYAGYAIAAIMAVGSCFAAMNTMYAAVAFRSREIATLRVLGFGRASILASFLLEAVIMSLAGAALGLLLVLPLHGTSTGTSNFVTFSEFLFSLRVTPAMALKGALFAVLMGVVGGVAPAWGAARRSILSALRS